MLFICCCRLMCLECTVGDESVPAGSCYIEAIAVHASARGKGIGKTLMEFADNNARSNNCSVRHVVSKFDIVVR